MGKVLPSSVDPAGETGAERFAANSASASSRVPMLTRSSATTASTISMKETTSTHARTPMIRCMTVRGFGVAAVAEEGLLPLPQFAPVP